LIWYYYYNYCFPIISKIPCRTRTRDLRIRLQWPLFGSGYFSPFMGITSLHPWKFRLREHTSGCWYAH